MVVVNQSEHFKETMMVTKKEYMFEFIKKFPIYTSLHTVLVSR